MDPVWRPYLLGQLPGWAIAALAVWVGHRLELVDAWLAVAIVAVVVLKDLLLFPWMRRFYKPSPANRRMIGLRGVAVTAVERSGLVRVRGELWQATSDRHIREGAAVIVRDASGLRLRVEAESVLPEPDASGT
jgi:membrane protein implicated in regulation of membrane protease activity